MGRLKDRGERCGKARGRGTTRIRQPPRGLRRPRGMGRAGSAARAGMASSGGSLEGGGGSPWPDRGGRPAEPTGAGGGPCGLVSGVFGQRLQGDLRRGPARGSHGPPLALGPNVPATRPCHRPRPARADRHPARRALRCCGAAMLRCCDAAVLPGMGVLAHRTKGKSRGARWRASRIAKACSVGMRPRKRDLFVTAAASRMDEVCAAQPDDTPPRPLTRPGRGGVPDHGRTTRLKDFGGHDRGFEKVSQAQSFRAWQARLGPRPDLYRLETQT